MKFMNKKTLASLIALLLTLTIAASSMSLPTVNAAVTYYNSLVYVATSRDVIGVGQELLLVMWTADMPPDIGEQTGIIAGGRAAWYGIKMVVTKPDNTTETLSLDKTDPVGGAYIAYTPNKSAHTMPKDSSLQRGKTQLPLKLFTCCGEHETAFTVQAEPIPAWAESPLPTEPWTRPINSASRAWNVLAGNWLGGDAI